MSIQIVVGSQWGDEGKGKIVDILSKNVDLVVRSQGGNNAGHTIKINKHTYTLKLIPSGILYENVKCLINSGVVINPNNLINEIETLKSQNVFFNNLKIDSRAHVIMPWHILFDEILEKARNLKIGTTKNGIGPCYADKAYRLSIQLFDLTNEKILKEKINLIGNLKNQILTQTFKQPALNLNEILENYLEYGKKLKPLLSNGIEIIYNALKHNKKILFEGAQGTMLDLNFGTYPFVTSSNTVAGGICTGSPIGPTKIKKTIGVAKAYLTRVGEGPMLTEIKNDIAKHIRNVGNEFGTNTKRPRRVGWLDCVMLKHAVQINSLSELIINKLDTLQGINPLKICYAYKNSKGHLIKFFPSSTTEIEKLKPLYINLPGFFESISNCTKFSQLPKQCKNYVKTIENLCDCKISMIGVGPNRNQNIVL